MTRFDNKTQAVINITPYMIAEGLEFIEVEKRKAMESDIKELRERIKILEGGMICHQCHRDMSHDFDDIPF